MGEGIELNNEQLPGWKMNVEIKLKSDEVAEKQKTIVVVSGGHMSMAIKNSLLFAGVNVVDQVGTMEDRPLVAGLNVMNKNDESDSALHIATSKLHKSGTDSSLRIFDGVCYSDKKKAQWKLETKQYRKK